MNIVERAQALLPGEDVRFAFSGQTGLRPTWRFLSLWLNIFNQTRVIAVTDKRIAVFAASQVRTQRTKPKKLIFELPRDTILGPLGTGGWSKITVGPERIWVARLTYPYIEKANAAAAARTAGGSVPPDGNTTEVPPTA